MTPLLGLLVAATPAILCGMGFAAYNHWLKMSESRGRPRPRNSGAVLFILIVGFLFSFIWYGWATPYSLGEINGLAALICLLIAGFAIGMLLSGLFPLRRRTPEGF